MHHSNNLGGWRMKRSRSRNQWKGWSTIWTWRMMRYCLDFWLWSPASFIFTVLRTYLFKYLFGMILKDEKLFQKFTFIQILLNSVYSEFFASFDFTIFIMELSILKTELMSRDLQKHLTIYLVKDFALKCILFFSLLLELQRNQLNSQKLQQTLQYRMP